MNAPMKARELAELLQHPDMDVAIAPFGGNNRWPVTRIAVEERDDTYDSTALGDSFLLISSVHHDIPNKP